MTIKTLFCAVVSSLSLAACAADGLSPVQRNAAIGGAIGAAAGAAVNDDDLEGALIGGALGAAIGAYTGCREQGGCFVGGKQVANRNDLVYDSRAQRYYYMDRASGRTYWENGQLRG
ncbi:MAG: glycine zipper 2TM domain-containing protein [Alphaproteobacteria bacterium]|nr:glycine zipper 2TM domain-containing protein [Alphaproteobacteria bacterium]